MAKLTIELQPELLAEVQRAAREAGLTAWEWVREQLRAVLPPAAGSEWPPGYFDLFGCLADDDSFQVPPEPLAARRLRAKRLREPRR